ncbi:MAG: polysaccharide biosynthesis protein [Bacillota bacterium]|nr:polysaccharide biosynthesis protein [Bacillota bacterium]HHU62230.1 polysaccharide biosynthesis protein [Natronincola sp.]
MTKESFLRGAVILALASLINRVIGLVYMIILPRLIYDEGMGLYQLIKPIHYFAAVVAISGMPVAISKLIAEKVARGSIKGVKSVFRIGTVIMVATGGIVAITLSFGSQWLAKGFAGDVGVQSSLIVLGPACFFLAISAAFRSYFHGLQHMTPTAVSQIVDQFVRVIATILITLWFRPMGVEKTVTGLAWGSLCGEFFGWFVLWVIYMIKGPSLLPKAMNLKRYEERESIKTIVYRLVSLAAPAVMATILWPIMQLADSWLIPLKMRSMGFPNEFIREGLGHLGMALTLAQFPNIITVALATSLVPAISEAWALKSKRLIRHRVEESLRIALIFGMPCFALLTSLATPLSRTLFGYSEVGEPLRILAIGAISLGLIQAATGILQGLGKMSIPVRNLAFGAVLKFALNYILVSNPKLGVLGAAWSTTIVWGVIASLNMISVFRRVGAVIRWKSGLLYPLLASGAMGILAYYLQDTFANFMPIGIVTIISLILCFVLYFLILMVLGGLEKRDIHLIPVYGRGLAEFLQEWGFLRS